MNLSIEVLKNSEEKYIFCRIEVEERPVFYFARQKKPHRTHRWLSTEQWATHDAKLRELVSRNKLDHLNKSLTYKLPGSLCLQLTNSLVSKNALLNALNNKDIRLEDVINVVDCKIKYQEDVSVNDCTLSTTEKVKEEKLLRRKAGHSEETQHVKVASSEYVDTAENNENSVVITCSNSSLISSTTQLLSQESEILPTPESKNSEVINVGPSDDIDRASPVFPHTNDRTNSVDKQLNERSFESDDLDVVERILSKNVQLNDKKFIDNKPAKSKKSDNIKETINIDITENETCDSDISSTPPESRKRKLHPMNDENSEKHRYEESATPRHKLHKTDKTDRNNIAESTATYTTRSSSASKKKKSHQERSKSPSSKEKYAIKNWITKTNSKAIEGDSKSDKPTTSKQSNSSRKHNGKFSTQNSHNSPHEKTDKSSPKSEQCKRIKQTDSCKLLPKEPQKFLVLDLKKVPANEILATYEDHRLELESIFRAQKSLKKCSPIDGVDHYFVINLVTDAVQHKLMDKLSEFENEAAPKYGSLFSMVLMPEWILRVFMAKFKMNRSEAIERIKMQNEYYTLNVFSCKELDKKMTKK